MYECYVEPGAKVPVFYDDYETHEERIQKREEIMAREDVINVTQQYLQIIKTSFISFAFLDLYIAAIFLRSLKRMPVILHYQIFSIEKILIGLYILSGAYFIYLA